MAASSRVRPPISKDTRLCMSLAARPGNFGTRFQNHLYDELGLDFLYKAFTTRDVPAAIGGIRALGIRGCAISMPFKEACIPLLDRLAPSAAAIRSVNTIVNDVEDGRDVLTGHNTDYTAIVRLIVRHAITPATSVALRGSGGMAKAVASAFRDSGVRTITIIARNERTGKALAENCGFAWCAVPEGVDAELVVNVTPIGMSGGPASEELAFPQAMIERARIVFDVVAAPVETPLIRAARALGRSVITGDEVLVLQGLEQFVLYTGLRPEASRIARAAAVALA